MSRFCQACLFSLPKKLAFKICVRFESYFPINMFFFFEPVTYGMDIVYFQQQTPLRFRGHAVNYRFFTLSTLSFVSFS